MDVSQNVSTTGALVAQSLNFQKIVLIIAIVILIVSLVFIGMQIKKSNSKQPWPPLVPQCPDYWKADSSGNCKPIEKAPMTQEIKNNTTCNPLDGIDFTMGVYAGADGACNKRKWATGCNAAWEGITYGTVDPCMITSIQ